MLIRPGNTEEVTSVDLIESEIGTNRNRLSLQTLKIPNKFNPEKKEIWVLANGTQRIPSNKTLSLQFLVTVDGKKYIIPLTSSNYSLQEKHGEHNMFVHTFSAKEIDTWQATLVFISHLYDKVCDMNTLRESFREVNGLKHFKNIRKSPQQRSFMNYWIFQVEVEKCSVYQFVFLLVLFESTVSDRYPMPLKNTQLANHFFHPIQKFGLQNPAFSNDFSEHLRAVIAEVAVYLTKRLDKGWCFLVSYFSPFLNSDIVLSLRHRVKCDQVIKNDLRRFFNTVDRFYADRFHDFFRCLINSIQRWDELASIVDIIISVLLRTNRFNQDVPKVVANIHERFCHLIRKPMRPGIGRSVFWFENILIILLDDFKTLSMRKLTYYETEAINIEKSYNSFAQIKKTTLASIITFYHFYLLDEIGKIPVQELVKKVCSENSIMSETEKKLLADHIVKRCDLVNHIIAEISEEGQMINKHRLVEKFYLCVFVLRWGKTFQSSPHRVFYENVLDNLCDFARSMQKHSLPDVRRDDELWHILQLQEYKGRYFKLLELCLEIKHQEKFSIDMCTFMTAIENLQEVKQSYENDIARLHTFLESAEDHCFLALCKDDRENIKSSFDKAKNGIITLRKQISKRYGTNIALLLSAAKHTMVDSKIYMNYSYLMLKETCSGGRKLSVESFCELLSNTTQFKEDWKSMVEYTTKPTFRKVVTLLNNIDDSRILDAELNRVKVYTGIILDEATRNTFHMVIRKSDLHEKAEVLCTIVDIFKIKDRHVVIHYLSLHRKRSDILLFDWKESLHCLMKLEKVLEEDSETKKYQYRKAIWTILRQLAKSRSLIEFLTDVDHDELRKFTEFMEDSFDASSTLIDIYYYLCPLLQAPDVTIEQLPDYLGRKKHIELSKVPYMVEKCLNNLQLLQQLYESVSSRDKISCRIISAALSEGQYKFSVDSRTEGCNVVLTFHKSHNEEHISSLEELKELRSRALLIASSDSAADQMILNVFKLQQFVQCVDNACEIVVLYNELTSYGFTNTNITLNFQDSRPISCVGLQQLVNCLQKELLSRRSVLKDLRRKHPFLNFFSCKQLELLGKFFDNPDFGNVPTSVMSLLKRVYPMFDIDNYEQATRRRTEGRQIPLESDFQTRIINIATELEIAFFHSKTVFRQIHKNFVKNRKFHVNAGDMFIAHLNKGSRMSIPVLLTLCQNTTGTYPQPSEVVFCQRFSKWEEIKVLLTLCTHTPAAPFKDRLYFIVNAEQLSKQIQVKLVEEIQVLQKNKDKVRLAIIYKGEKHDHFIRLFPRNTHLMQNIDEGNISECLKADFPNVEVVTSQFPGLGKTEYISKSDRVVHQVLVGGPFDKHEYVKTLSIFTKTSATRTGKVSLHFNVTAMDDPTPFDLFIFEFLVTGEVSSGIYVCGCNFRKVFIEIGNSVENYLLRSLHFCLMLKKTDLEWSNFDDFDISYLGYDAQSPVQIVCKYKMALNNNTLDCTDLKLKSTRPIDQTTCRELLREIFEGQTALSFTVVENFLRVLSEELKKFSDCSNLQVVNVNSDMKYMGQKKSLFMLFQKPDPIKVRSDIVEQLFENAFNITVRQYSFDEATVEGHTWDESEYHRERSAIMVSQQGRLQPWTDKKYFLIVFNRQDPNTRTKRLNGDDKLHSINQARGYFTSSFSKQTTHGKPKPSIPSPLPITTFYRDSHDIPDKAQHLLSHLNKRQAKLDFAPADISNDLIKDVNDMSQEELRFKLERFCQKTNEERTQTETWNKMKVSYVLTPDNVLKMVLILLRINAHLPVVIRGHTGCGKTMMIQYLACMCEIELYTFRVHAGTTDTDIVSFVHDILEEMRLDNGNKSERWVFFDEINACENLGLLTEIICRRIFKGKRLPSGLICLAACNPCILKDPGTRYGLKTGILKSELSKLVYRVFPLPDTMMEHVWDFGELYEEQEKLYIKRMVERMRHEDQVDDEVQISMSSKLERLFAELIFKSQQFIRIKERSSCLFVSLRDVDRCLRLYKWIRNNIWSAGVTPTTMGAETDLEDKRVLYRSMILALVVCYQTRLVKPLDREKYQEELGKTFLREYPQIDLEYMKQVIEEEEMQLIDRLKLPRGIAKNEALRENVLVLFFGIMTKTPVFLEGKPGSSKSLSLDLLTSRLKGLDSSDTYFQSLPAVLRFTYQGSVSSTAQSIKSVFTRAASYGLGEHNKHRRPLVVFDEIGLAENSPNNPLMVLHSLLDANFASKNCDSINGLSSVAFVGISNWALDAAKMNRGLHVSRSDPDLNSLTETAGTIYGDLLRGGEYDQVERVQIGESNGFDDNMAKLRGSLLEERHSFENRVAHNNICKAEEHVDQLHRICTAYYEYKQVEKIKDFHGLRDFYSQIRYLAMHSLTEENKTRCALHNNNVTLRSLLRNFSGYPKCEMPHVRNTMQPHLKIKMNQSDNQQALSTPDMIRESITDKSSRHLMLITKGDFAFSFLQQLSKKSESIKLVFLIRSQFEDDSTDEYEYRILNIIIGIMKTARTLVLYGLDKVYSCLYEILNHGPNYALILGETYTEKNRFLCRVAFGANCNSMCEVHPDFKCIVLQDHKTLESVHPPFLNRFEKYYLSSSDLLNDSQEHMIRTNLNSWVDNLTSIDRYAREEAFLGFNEDTIPLLLLKHSEGTLVESSPPTGSGEIDQELELEKVRIIEQCKEDILHIACSDAVVRMSRSKYVKDNPVNKDEVERLQQRYFQFSVHKGLKHFITGIMHDDQLSYEGTLLRSKRDASGLKMILYTYSSIHSDLEESVKNCSINIQIEQLCNYSSEQQLKSMLETFWKCSHANMIIIQCKLSLGYNHILMVRLLVDTFQERFNHERNRAESPDSTVSAKHVCLVVHVERKDVQQVQTF